MQRRHFLGSSLAAAALGVDASTNLRGQQPSGEKNREYYELRRYHLQSGPHTKLTEGFLAEALLPGLNRLGIKPVGVFRLDIGVETPSLYVLIPSTSVETLVTAEFRLRNDEEYLKAGEKFLNAPAKDVTYARIESSLMIAFEGWPKLTVPPITSQHGSRVFELRTYESSSNQDHRRKVEMFHSGEFDIFQKAGFWEIFYGDTLIGSRLPNLTYMLGFPDLAERNSKWKAFGSDPEWKKLISSPKFNFEDIVSNITNLILSPTSYSQI
ncbi:MAG TPA: NIPSNAP family containing protein [Solibacterales bacterium]|nr:NIPSNAP family containing protein [Bryobacterales bacterium]